jgi:hypothetical protein
MQIFPSWNCNMLIFLPWRCFVPETFCYRRRSVTETFCYGDVLHGDVLSRRRFVRRRFVCAPFESLLERCNIIILVDASLIILYIKLVLASTTIIVYYSVVLEILVFLLIINEWEYFLLLST